MNFLKPLWLAILHLGRQARLLPQAVAAAFQQRQQRIEKDRFEVERLDRIRNPSKYLGR